MGNDNGAAPASQVLANIATDEDKLFRSGYVKGIAEFLRECATPMSIAIQGDWGSGKTSLINLVEHELRSQTEPGMFADPNAAAYCDEIIGVANVDVSIQSAANPDGDLFMFLLGKIFPKLAGSDLVNMAELSEFASAASQVVEVLSLGDDSSDKNDPLVSLLTSFVGTEEDSKSKKDDKSSHDEIAKAIIEVHNTLGEALKQSAERNGKTENARLVVFVDGLDHINPEAAVTLLDWIKTYIDVPRCVFVYAVDEKTVFDGLRKKLGEKSDDRKIKRYFDKLIQVPLRIPESTYNLGVFIRSLLQSEGEKQYTDEFVRVVETILRAPTPHRIKRYLNAMYLYRGIFGGAHNVDDSLLPMLYAAVILRLESTQAFNAVAKCAQGDEEHFAERLNSAMGSSDFGDGVYWSRLPELWRDGESGDEDDGRKAAFISWICKLK